jgi:hypothetical protein
MEYLGAWGTLIHEKNLKSKRKSRVRLPLMLAKALAMLAWTMSTFRDSEEASTNHEDACRDSEDASTNR